MGPAPGEHDAPDNNDDRDEDRCVQDHMGNRGADVREEAAGRRARGPIDTGAVGGLDQQGQRDEQHDERNGRRHDPAPRDPARRQEGQRKRLTDRDECGPEVAVRGERRHDGESRPAEAGSRIVVLDTPDEEIARRAHEQERKRIATGVLGELDEERVDGEQQAGQQRGAGTEQPAGQHDDHPERPDCDDDGQASQGDLAVTEHHPPPQQQVVERHVRLAVCHHVGEDVPRRCGQRGTDGLVEEETVGVEEQRPENGSEHQLHHHRQPPLP